MKQSAKVGRGRCPTCGHGVQFRRSEATGRISYACDECDSSGYADRDSNADAAWSKSIAGSGAAPAVEVKAPAVEVKPAAAEAHANTPEPHANKPAKTKAAAFELGGL